tara:strand:- start:2771 stop:3415 length:645 start_codon:yes stop_codon:yes gene_type:complete
MVENPFDDSLRPEGVSGEDTFKNGRMPISPLKITPGMTLSTLSEEYVFFNHGALFSYGELPVDPAEEYILENRTNLRLVMSSDVLFPGLSGGNTEYKAWEYALVLAPLTDWDGLMDTLLQTAIMNRGTKTFFRTYGRLLLVNDWLQSPIISSNNQVQVTIFGLDGNKQFVGFKEHTGRMLVESYKPRPETIEFGARLLKGENPYDEPGTNENLA